LEGNHQLSTLEHTTTFSNLFSSETLVGQACRSWASQQGGNIRCNTLQQGKPK